MWFLQDMTKCSPQGRDCIERISAESFFCNTTCEGIYANVDWVEDIMNSELAMKEKTGSVGQKADKMDEKKYQRLVLEYKTFKRENCQHFRFSSTANTTNFGNF